jgi:hypothetical protein
MTTYGYVRNSFNFAATGFDAEPAQAPTPQKTILESISNNKLSYKANITPVSTLNVSADKANAPHLAEENAKKVEQSGQQVAQAKGNISQTIELAQAQVAMVCKSLGYDASVLYPDNRMAAGNESGLMIEAAMSKWGQGSAFKSLLGNLPTIDNAMDDMRDIKDPKVRDKVEGLIRERLSMASNQLEKDSRQQNNNGAASADASAEKVNGTLDWKKFFEEGHQLKELMSLDPDNPNEKLIPEMKALNVLDREVKTTRNSLEQTKDKIKADGKVMNATEQSNKEADKIEIEKPKCNAGDVYGSVGLQILGIKIQKDPQIGKEAKDALWENNNEFDPNKLKYGQPAGRMQISGTMGGG